MRKFIQSSSHQVLLVVLACVLSCLVNGQMTRGQTDWQPCSLHCNCSLFDGLVVGKCDLSTVEQCESFVIPDDALIL